MRKVMIGQKSQQKNDELKLSLNIKNRREKLNCLSLDIVAIFA